MKQLYLSEYQLQMCSLVLWLVEHVGQAALPAVLAVEMSSHEHSSAALLSRALTPKSVNLAVLVLNLLGSGVILLLALLGATPEPQHQVQGTLLLDVVVTEGAPILELLPSEDKPLLVWRDSLLVLNFGLHILDGIGWFHLKGDGLARKGLHEDLHDDLLV